jgi:citrate synthase
VVALESAICTVIGDPDLPEGRLIYRGYDIHDLAQHSTFEETTYLLWHGDLPNRAQLAELQQQLEQHRTLPQPVVDLMRRFPPQSTPMDVLRTTVSALQLWDPQENEDSEQANHDKAMHLTAQMPMLVAAWHAIRSGREPLAPQPGQSTARAFLYMLNGEEPSDVAERTLDIALILHADHELNASTFAARVTAATLADVHSAVTSAIGALIGPLHGGANEAVLRMLQEIGEPSRVESYVHEKLARHEKIMGIGHAVYKTKDPRATHLREMSRQLGESRGDLKLWEMSRQVEDLMLREKKLHANVDFYSASTYHALGIPMDLFTPVFAVSRIAGWTAHVLEQYADNKLIRPRAQYIGQWDRQYVPIEQRG